MASIKYRGERMDKTGYVRSKGMETRFSCKRNLIKFEYFFSLYLINILSIVISMLEMVLH